MPTLVVHARRSPETIARILLLFHRRALEVERIVAEGAQDSETLSITITFVANQDQARRKVANLYKLEDVLLVERNDSSGDRH
jgi:acetolactate synthase regulatory subunit